MIVTFAEPSALNSEFRTDLLVFGALVIIITIAFQVSYRNSPLAMSFKMRCLLALLAFLGVGWYAYASSYQQFTRVEMTDADVRLTFVGPLSRDVILAPRDIVKVTYGLSDRGSSKCRVTIEGRSAKYHSAWVPNKAAICQEYRDDMLRALAGDLSSSR
jgi:hypothetical protein